MRPASLLLLVVLSGCYSLGPLVADVTPAGVSNDGRPQIEVRRCLLAWGMFKQLQLEECRSEPIVLETRPAPKARR